MLKKVVWLVLIVVVAVGALRLKQYFSPENVIRRTMFKAVGAFEEEHLIGTLKIFDRAYSDPWGQSYEVIAGHVRVLQETFDGLRLDLEVSRVVLAEGTAVMELTFVLWGSEGGRRGTIFGRPTEPCTATLGWAKGPDGWRIGTTTELDIPELREEIQAARRGHS